ncbi:hypothetical protein [Natrinema sp. SYSU A 869]|uniref:hypothetical protein n=1 Tax=Natrinema sp. SYSU A 869 TaxID=2871694 RepID=UPI001CA40A97|nr:hypothetical protein [Natrinema sp. SYSU A 869]
MEHTSRRRLLAAVGFGTSLTALSAGCLDTLSENETDESNEPDDSSASSMTPLERWVPASGSAELLFHYRDLTAVRRYEDDLQAAVVEDVPTVPDVEGGEIVEQLTDDKSAVESVLRFGSEGVAGNVVVVAGSFDPDAVDAESKSAAGEFEILERDGVSVAISAETVVVSPDDGADLDAILAAGVEGTNRRVDEHEHFAQLTECVGESTFLWGEYEGDADGTGVAFSLSVGSDTSTAVYADADRADEFEEMISDRFEDVTVEVDGNVVVATRTVPTEEYEYQDLFAERGSEPTRPRAGVSIDSDSSDRTVTMSYISRSEADRLEISDESGNEDEMTEVGQTITFEYETGASGELTVVAVGGETETVVAAYSYSF